MLTNCDFIVFPSVIKLQAKRFLDPASIFESDIDETKQKVQESIETLLLFRYTFAVTSFKIK